MNGYPHLTAGYTHSVSQNMLKYNKAIAFLGDKLCTHKKHSPKNNGYKPVLSR